MKRPSFVLLSVLILLALRLVPLGPSEAAAQGGATRRVKIIAFIDLTESNTQRFFQTVYKTIKQTYGDRVEFVWRHVPRPGPGGSTVAEAYYCAADQGRPWDFIETLVAGPYTGDKPGMSRLAAQLRLNPTLFSECLERGKKRAAVEADIREVNKVGLRGIPTFYVQGEPIEGLVDFGVFRAAIDRQLQTTTRAPIKIQILYNSQFRLEDPHKQFSYLKTYFFPDSELSLVSHRSPEGQKLVKEVGARALPTIIFSREIEQSPQFKYFQEEMEKRGPRYLLKLEAYTGILEFFEAPPAGGNPVKGNDKTPITIMEFSDFECPSCGEFVRTTLPRLTEKYIKTGQARLVFRNYPIMSLHPKAEGAALASECAHKAGIFWPYHDTLYQNAKNLDRASLVKYAERLGQNGNNFAACIHSADARTELQKDITDAKKFGVRSTPTLLINNYRVSGTDPFSVFAVIDYLLRKQTPAQKTPAGHK